MNHGTHGGNPGPGGFRQGGTGQGGGGLGQGHAGPGPGPGAAGPPSFVPNTYYPDEFGQGGFGQTDYTKIVIFGCVMLTIMAVGGLIMKWAAPTPAPAAAAPAVVPLHVQAQQAAIEALNTHQQMMIEMRRQMAETERGYYEDEGMAEYSGDEDGGW
ncbi:MAG: hypothetical protein KJZ69_11660 [Phycisphaerales bacterium]|nr:hypothetical protein [Phycisphaerales bacterium]